MKKGLVAVAIVLVLCRVVPGPWGCGGTTGTDSGTGTTDSLGGAPTGFNFTDSDGNTVSSTTRGATAQLRDSSDNVLLAFTTDGSVDFTNVTVTRTASKAVVHFPASTDKAGLTGSLVMHVPCDATANQVRVCPSATTADETATGCAGELALNGTTSTSGDYTWDNASTRTGTSDCEVSASVENFGTGAFGEESGDVQPTLTTGDFPAVSPCSDRDTLPSDTTFLDVITNASQAIHVHKQYESDANLSAVCGLPSADNSLPSGGTGWDPSSGTNVNACNLFASTLLSFFVTGTNHPGICRSSFGFSTDVAEGFPRAGTYRLESCIEQGGNSYQVRVRVTVSGDDADKTLSAAGVANVEALEVFNSAGTEVTTSTQAKALFTDNPTGFTFTVRSENGAQTHLTVQVGVICIKKLTEACPSCS